MRVKCYACGKIDLIWNLRVTTIDEDNSIILLRYCDNNECCSITEKKSTLLRTLTKELGNLKIAEII